MTYNEEWRLNARDRDENQNQDFSDRYMSTNDFVFKNQLQKQADELFGEGWEAEDDIDQIEKLCNHVSPNKYMVSSIHGLKYEDDIEVREIDGLTTKEDIMEFCDELATQITEERHGEETWTSEEWDSENEDNCVNKFTDEAQDFYNNMYGVIEQYIDKNYILNFVRK